MKRNILLIVGFYFLMLLQVSFLPFFSVFGTVPNLVFISAILLNIFEKPGKKTGILIAGFAGLLLDIYSSSPLGFYFGILIALSLLIKIVVKKQFELQINPLN